MPTGTDQVLDFILGFNWESAGEAVHRQAARCLLDSLGALLAGGATPLGALSARLAARHMPATPEERCTLVVGGTASLLGAAFANGFASNALDVEHGYRPAQGRPGACLLPVLCALAETSPWPVRGADFLAALVIGYEVAIRAGLLRHTDERNVFTTGAWASLGAVAAGARLLRLPRGELKQALGSADYHSPLGLILRGVETPCMAKDGVGWGAFTAMSSLLLAREGFTAPEPLFTGTRADEVVADLGRTFRFSGLYFKPYCSCRWTHAAIDGALALLGEHGLAAKDLERVQVRTFHHAAALSRKAPEDTEHAQYNLTYPLAAALVDGRVDAAQVLPPRLADPDILGLQARIEVEVCEEFEAQFPERTISEVLVTAGGRTWSSGAREPRWEAGDAPADAVLEEKFLRLVEPVVGPAAARKLAHAALHLAQSPDCRPLLRDLPLPEHP